jgi:DNA-binding MarR family transcriptional regulator
MTADVSSIDPELNVLESIYLHSEHIRQRDLARIAGLSLGMTNAIVKRLVQKGWLSIRKVNNRNLRYAVSPEGIEEIARRSYRFVKRTVRYIVDYREAIDGFIRRLKTQGIRGIVVVGGSDLDFIVEHSCRIQGLDLLKDEMSFKQAFRGEGGIFLLYSEAFIPDKEEKARAQNVAFLQDVIAANFAASREV